MLFRSSSIETATNELKRVIDGEERIAIDTAVHQLSHATEEFAARRMDQSVKRALAGKKLEELDL